MVFPFIKWAGSKRPIAAALAQHYPAPIKRYVEPFVGGGSLLPLAPQADSYLASDLYPPLIALWEEVQRHPQALAARYRQHWTRLQDEGASYYYEVRKAFNAATRPEELLFLTRTCYNGLFRLNGQGQFNVSFHHRRRGMDPGAMDPLIAHWSRVVENITFACGDYEEVTQAQEGDFWVLDPPYHWERDGGFYQQGPFDAGRFLEFLEHLDEKRCQWLLLLDEKSSRQVPQKYERLVLSGPPSAHARLRTGTSQVVQHVVIRNYL